MKRGFTLIETLVYLALFTLFMGGFVTAAYALFENGDRNQTKAMLQDEENFVMGKTLWALESAKTVNPPNSSTLTITPYAGPPVTITRSGANVLWNSAAQPLNNSNVAIKALTFTHVGSGSGPESVQVDMTASATASNGMLITQSVSSMRYIRK